jgi:Ser-tRNA(Ala) deacylase AlaX
VRRCPSARPPLVLGWAARYRNMRSHTLVRLCDGAAVTGGAITDDGGRIDFDIPDGGIRTRNSPSGSHLMPKITRCRSLDLDEEM